MPRDWLWLGVVNWESRRVGPHRVANDRGEEGEHGHHDPEVKNRAENALNNLDLFIRPCEAKRRLDVDGEDKGAPEEPEK